MCKSHTFTVRWLFDCENCHAPVSSDDTGFDGENNWCPECVAEFNNETAIDLYGRWLAEKRGMLS